MVNTRRALLADFSAVLFCKIRLHQIKMEGTLSEADLLMDAVHAPGQNYFPSVNFKKNAAGLLLAYRPRLKCDGCHHLIVSLIPRESD
jgi:hypothetical protein